jgi:hypothetical protein
MDGYFEFKSFAQNNGDLPQFSFTERFTQVGHRLMVMVDSVKVQDQIESCDEVAALVSEVGIDPAV